MKAITIAAVAILLCGCRPQEPKSPLAVRCVKIEGERFTFDVTNSSPRYSYMVDAQNSVVETNNDGSWQTCDYDHNFGGFDLGPHYYRRFTLHDDNLPPGAPLRLNLPATQLLMGIEGWPKRIAYYWKIRRYPAAHRRPSLNPLNHTWVMSGAKLQVYSQEFTK